MSDIWPLIHTERAALADDLATLDDDQWHHATLSTEWTVEEVVAHLTAAASLGTWSWIRSIVAAGFDPGRHNNRRLAEHLGETPQQTLENFRAVIDSRRVPTGTLPAWLGEVVIHGEDIRRPLNLHRDYPDEVLVTLLDFFESSNFTVPSKARARGLMLVATDVGHWVGAGPEVNGTALDLIMAMAGRPVPAERFSGAGAFDFDARGHEPSQRR
ncbi:maleylpyruvate isomerase family mycothiol-dependent enzyme [Citricoccus sp. GCM10030269]|uniref:maleylpyruvate isomerase family mycothiol-dependent enzyme n=1 Tax=Citricoccus sp. GCM10030269 TaxID=3273388 RepID=UPI00361B961F